MFALCLSRLGVQNLGFAVTGVHSDVASRVLDESVHLHFRKDAFFTFTYVYMCACVSEDTHGGQKRV